MALFTHRAGKESEQRANKDAAAALLPKGGVRAGNPQDSDGETAIERGNERRSIKSGGEHSRFQLLLESTQTSNETGGITAN